MKNKLERYLKELNKGLHLPGKIKKQITAELSSEIYSRIDDGEELDSIHRHASRTDRRIGSKLRA